MLAKDMLIRHSALFFALVFKHEKSNNYSTIAKIKDTGSVKPSTMFIKVCLYAYLGAHAINPLSDSHEACVLASDFAENGLTD